MKFTSNGFTIVELLIVITIIVLLPVIVISNFPQIKGQFSLSRAVYKMSQDLRMAQNMALSSVPYKDSFGRLQSVGGYGIYINTRTLGNKKYILYANNNNNESGNKKYDVLDHVITTVDFSQTEPGVVIKDIENTYNSEVSINFAVSSAHVVISDLSQGQGGINIVFALESDMAKTRAVFVNTAGLIEVK